MGIFDSLPKKMVDRSPPSFGALVTFASLIVEDEDLPRIAAASDRESYSAYLIGMLAVVANGIGNEWSADAMSYIVEKTKLAQSRLAGVTYRGGFLRELAELRARELIAVHYRDDARYRSHDVTDADVSSQSVGSVSDPDVQVLARDASDLIISAMGAVETHIDSIGLQRIYWFIAGLTICAYETHFRGTSQEIDEGFHGFISSISGLIYPHYAKLCSEWNDEDDTFEEVIIAQWMDAEYVWPAFLDNARSGMGHLAFPRALKDADIFDDPKLRTVATLAAMVVIERAVKL